MNKVEKNVETYLKDDNASKDKCNNVAENILKELCRKQPSNATYETIFNGKAGYNQIVQQFEEAREYLVDEETTGLYLMALVDTLENISEEIFEYYRHLQLLLKETVAKVMESKNVKNSDKIAYVLMKGVRLGHLSEEYLELGIKTFEELVHQKPKDVNSFMKAYGEYHYLKK